MAKLLVGNKYCKITEEDDVSFIRKVDNLLSFKLAGADFLPSVKAGLWNGYEHLLSKKLEFYSGLEDKVIKLYSDNNRTLEIVNCRTAKSIGKEIDILDNLKSIDIVPYDYQMQAVEEALIHDRLILKHATGSGKSASAALIIAKLGLPSIVYVIGIDLLYQFHAFFTKVFPTKKIGIIGDGHCDIGDINIISIWSVGKALGMKKGEILQENEEIADEKYKEKDKYKILHCIKSAKIVLLDECHVAAAATIKNIYKNSEPDKIIGLSGTPVRSDGADMVLEGIFGNYMHVVSASSLIKRGILAKPFIKFIYVKGTSHFTDNYNKVYADNIVNNEFRNNIIIAETEKLVNKNYTVLVLYKQLKHGDILKDLFDKRGIDVEYLSGKNKSDDREIAKQNILNGKSKVLLASQIFDLGIDIGNLSGLVLSGSGKSFIRCLQRIGRVLRGGSNKGKPFVAVIDFFDQAKYLTSHSKIRKEIYETEEEFKLILPKNVKI